MVVNICNMNRPIRIITFHSIRKKIATPKVDAVDVLIIARIATTIYTAETICM